ncbi:zinc transporter ZupT [Roseicella aerolata]|uniref:Zinc transporter ZupT n=1 Tax=Roseicella aerolata TaxID=2883479 RepID=A0A9X1IC55_9PROT|nr:zinc transporter ZupT [Roseicella aerolata]MCB4822120.1 zinc transporter ZupT [Roseicella aerolata]
MSGLFSEAALVALGVTVLAGLSTVLGSLAVARADRADPRLLAVALAFAGGAMVYVSLVEILGKAAVGLTAEHGLRWGHGLATLAFFGGVLVVIGLDRLVPNPHPDVAVTSPAEKRELGRVGLLAAAAITAHNLPEGMATFFATLEDPVLGSTLAVAIALHNIPEGISIAVPVFYATGSRWKAGMATVVAGFAEPVGAVLGYLVLAPILSPTVIGLIFGAIAGVMVFLALDELLPAAKRYAEGHEATYGLIAGMGMLALSLVLLR